MTKQTQNNAAHFFYNKFINIWTISQNMRWTLVCYKNNAKSFIDSFLSNQRQTTSTPWQSIQMKIKKISFLIEFNFCHGKFHIKFTHQIAIVKQKFKFNSMRCSESIFQHNKTLSPKRDRKSTRYAINSFERYDGLLSPSIWASVRK